MTEGIIQNTTDKIYQQIMNDAKLDSWNKHHCSIYLQSLEQELIENIKREYPICGKTCLHNRFVCPNHHIQKKLIGDNI